MIIIDENLSDKLVNKLRDLFPDLLHVKQLGLTRTKDSVIWQYAQRQSIRAILSADSDLVTLAIELGTPPKVIQIAECNFTTSEVADLLRQQAVRITRFLASEKPVLVLKH